MSPRYAELQVTSHFSFLRGASSAEELFVRAAELGIEALAVTDRNSLAGIVRAHVAAKETGVRLVVGCRLDLADGTALLVYPADAPAYARLSRLLSLGKRRGGKGRCRLEWADVAAAGEGQIAVLLPDLADDACAFRLARLQRAFDGRAYMALTLRRRPDDALRLWRLSAMAAAAGVPTVVTNDVLFHEPGRRVLQDVVTAIRHGVTINELGFRRERHADRHLKPPGEMQRLFSRYPEALARTLEIAERCRFSLDELRYQYPEERIDLGLTPQQTLERLVGEGAAERFPRGVPDKVAATLKHELDLIARLDYAPYFLTVHSIVRFARSRGILCQGRGSAANSAVCYVLGITSIDPVESNLLFERFVSEERREPPDIDVDFEHERREEVIQWIYDTYGRDRAALCATVIRYRTKGAIRDVGKALGLPEDMTRVLSAQAGGHFSIGDIRQAGDLGLDMGERRLRLTLELAGALVGAPRHLSQHPGGFVLTRDRLDDLVPVEPAAMADRQVIEWDKDDIAVLDFMKVDVLALGMLSCMRRAFELLAGHKGTACDLYSIPDDDRPTYAMIARADTLGTFQIESRAQMSMLPRLKPKEFYDLVIQIAIVRPGPIQGDMVHPYLRRREKKEKVEYPSPAFEAVLGKTLGVPLFQEQAMRVAIECAGFSANEADRLRRAMATFKNVGTISAFRKKLVDGMVANGYAPEFAARIFRQLEGFGSYGFPESHAASFARIAYASAWVKCHHPEVFCCALLNAQPMGFYAPVQIVRDARAHGVEVLPVCINASRRDCTLERQDGEAGRLALRLGLRMVRGLADGDAARLVVARGDEPYRSVDDLWRRTELAPAALAALAGADAFRPSLGLVRRRALWTIRALREAPLPLFAAADARERRPRAEQDEPLVPLPAMPAGGEVVEDYGHLGLTLRAHPLSFLRASLARRRIVACAEATAARDGARVEVAGLILVRQRPGSARGVVFMTIEDETAIANVVIWQKLFQRDRAIIIGARMIGVRGRVQREGEVVHIVADGFLDLSDDLATVGARDDPAAPAGGAAVAEIRVRSRDFK